MLEPGRRALPSGRALVAVLIWGASFVATRVALEVVPPATLVALRLALGTAFLVAVLRLRGGGPFLPARADRPRCLLLGAVLGGHSFLQAQGLVFTSAINTGWIIAAIPALIALGAWLVLGQRLRPVGWGGIAVATSGVAAISLGGPAGFVDARLGDLLQLASCFTWTVYTLAAPGVVARNGALRVTAFVLGTAAAVMLLPALVAAPGVGTPSWETVAAVAYLGLLSNGVAMLLWYQALRREGPTGAGALLYVEPFSTLAAAHLVLGEVVGPGTLPGGLAVLLGVWLVGRGSPRP